MFFIPSNYVFIFKWIILMIFHTNQGLGANSSEFADIENEKYESNYPAIEHYFSLDNIPSRRCEVICSLSGLTTVQGEMLSTSFNNALNHFASSHHYSNIHRLDWNNYLAEIAKAKSVRCLPPTYKNDEKIYQLYDGVTLDKYLKEIFGMPIKNAMLEVVIARRELSKEAPKNRDLFMMEYYSKLFFSNSSHFQSRLSSIAMGCGYIVEKAEDRYYDQMLCMFGPLYKDRKIIPQLGPMCSECTFYSKMKFDGAYGKWSCDLKFTNLCADLTRKQNVDELYSLYNCSKSAPTFPPLGADGRLRDTGRETDLPCLPIFIPLSLIAILFLILCLYNIVTALLFKKNREK